MSRSTQPGEGQGMLFEVPVDVPTVEVDNFTYAAADFDAPATSLADYYTMLHKVVTEIGHARSKSIGFAKLSETSAPVKEYEHRMETTEADEAQRVVVRSSRKNMHKAQDTLFRHNDAEYGRLIRYAKATGAYTIEAVQAAAMVPPDVTTIEFKYFSDPNKTPKELRALRAQLARRAKRYGQTTSDQVA